MTESGENVLSSGALISNQCDGLAIRAKQKVWSGYEVFEKSSKHEAEINAITGANELLHQQS